MTRNYKQGTFIPQNRNKWIGSKNPVYRSGWEKKVFMWADINPDIVAISSERVVVPYVSPVDGNIHRYYIDLLIKYRSGSIVLVEIKPANQSRPPVAKRGKSKKTLLEQQQTWSVNESKWKAASAYAKKQGITFQVWTEDVLTGLGIPVK